MGQFARIQLVGNARSDSETAGSKRYKLTRENPETGAIEPMTDIRNSEELQFAMTLQDENGNDVYSKDAAFRETVKDLVANSPALFAEPSLARKSPIPTNEEFLAGLKRDALIQRRNELVDAAGGKDAIAKYNLALELMNPDNFETAHEMGNATEQERPFEQYLKDRNAAGMGALKWHDTTSESAPEKLSEEAHNQAILDEMGEQNDAIVEMGE